MSINKEALASRITEYLIEINNNEFSLTEEMVMDEQDEAMQANRKLLNKWIVKRIDPEVRNVTVWIDHSKLNLDINLGAIWPLGAILKQALKNLRIRRVSIKPLLPGAAAKKKKDPSRRGARRRPGYWRVR